MNPVPFTLALFATAALGFAQGTPGAPATTAPATTGAAAAKAKALAAGDKTFIKSSAESLYYLNNLAEKSRNGAKSDAVKTLGGKLKADFDKAWGDIGSVATANGETMPSELKGSDKSNSAKLGKAGDKFDKEFLDLAGKELKRFARSLETGTKMVQNAELKAAAEKWSPTMKDYSEQIEKTEKELSKKP